MKFMKDFEKPSSEFRGAPFWAWNGKLDEKELRRQIRIMNKMGLGGFFMHSRVGLDTEYLSEDWFKCINACIDEAEKLDMKAWLYDEDRWPSGAAGGIVTKNKDFRERMLVMEEVYNNPSDFKVSADTVAVFAGVLNGSSVKNIRVLKDDYVIAENETLLHFYEEISGDSSWYNGQAYLDTLNSDAVKEFIQVTHEKYKSEIGEHFAKVIPGIFTDEPNHSGFCQEHSESKISIPWSIKIRHIFKKMYEYDITDYLPELFLDIEGITLSKARYHFHNCVTSMFVNAFAKQIGEWCDENNMMHTGHVLEEDTLSRATHKVGSCMRFYEYMQAPGMDLLTEHWRIYLTAKQVSSVARQFDRKWRLSETYGCTGWDFPFAGHKALGDWQLALGINLRCQHLAWYTMQGQAKRDYPASISYQSSWWNEYCVVEDYFARINAVMINGKEVRDLLVIHANESMWTMCKKGWMQSDDVKKYDNMFIDIQDSLLDSNIDYDYGDEEIIARHTSIIKDAKTILLKLGEAIYRTILIPPLRTIRSTTLKILEEFQLSGGNVVFVDDIPAYVDAVASEEVAKFASSCIQTSLESKSIIKIIEKTTRKISIKDELGEEIPNTLFLLKEDADNSYLFVCNTGFTDTQRKEFDGAMVDSRAVERSKSYNKITIRGFEAHLGMPIELEPSTGEAFNADGCKNDNKWTINTSLPALGSRLFVIPKKENFPYYPMRKKLIPTKEIPLDKDKWDIRFSEDNVLVLDLPRYKINDGKYNDREEILNVDHILRDELEIERRGGQMVQPWVRKKNSDPKSITVKLEYDFNVEDIPKFGINLAMENPEKFRILFNDVMLDSDSECGWWCDKSLRKIAVDCALFKKGKNTIEMICNYDENHSGLEIIYLLGKFGVNILPDAKMQIVNSPETLKLGDWTKQGLPFYSAGISYYSNAKIDFKSNERVVLKVAEYDATLMKVFINSKETGVIAWEPNEIDITDYIKSGKEFELAIEVISHRRNSHGSLHYSGKWPVWSGPAQFIVTEDDLKKKYNLVPCGLRKNPVFFLKREEV